MRKTIWWLLLVAGLVLLAAIPYYHSLRKPEPRIAPFESPVAETPMTPEPVAPEGPRHPLPLLPLEKPLPALDTSDATVRNGVAELWSDPAVEERLHFRDFIRRVVATIDNLPRRKVAQRLMPVKRVDGAYAVTGDDASGYAMHEENAKRYEPYVRLMEAVSPSKLVALYTRLYPLFQQAYEDLGYPGHYFNDRLMVAIDDMLAAPELDTPPQLVRPKVFYLYADPDLESRSAGQKILMRMGRHNAARVKASLSAIRAELERQSASVARAR